MVVVVVREHALEISLAPIFASGRALVCLGAKVSSPGAREAQQEAEDGVLKMAQGLRAHMLDLSLP